MVKMKVYRYLLLFLVVVFSSCSQLESLRTVTPIYIDFSSYLAEGFYLNPNPYVGQCEILGELEIIVTPSIKEQYYVYKYVRGEDGRKRYIREIVPSKTPGSEKRLLEEEITRAELIEIAVAEAKKKGANGFVDYRITERSRNTDSGASRNYYYITGLCIEK